MTLHLALITNHYVVQVGDRLLSTRSGKTERWEPWEPQANKTVFLSARNGHIVIGYAGLAYVNRQPTDEWLVDQITGGRVAAGIRPRTRDTLFVPPLNLDIGTVVNRIESAIAEALPLQMNVPEDLRLIELLITGITWPRDVNRSNARPKTYARMSSHSGRPGELCRITPVREFTWGVGPGDAANLLQVGANCNLDLDRIEKRLFSGTTAADAEALLVDEVRKASGNGTFGIGSDLMTVQIDTGDPIIRYLPTTSNAKPRVSYSCWITTTGGAIVPPQEMTNAVGYEVSYGQDENGPRFIHVESGTSVVSPGASRWSSQQRRRLR